MAQAKLQKASLIKPGVTPPVALTASFPETPEKIQTFNSLQDEIWQAFLKKLEKPVRQIHSQQFRIVEVLGAVRFYISHSTGEIQLKVRYDEGNTATAFESYTNLYTYNLDLPLFNINLVVEAFCASWNRKISQIDSNFVPCVPSESIELKALFACQNPHFQSNNLYFQLIASINKAVNKSVLWLNLRHQVRDALKIAPEIMRIARKAKSVRKLKDHSYLSIEYFNNVIKHITGYRQLDQEAPNLLWLYTIALEEKVIPKGELIQSLKKMLVYYSGCRERGWRIICKSNIRDFEPALEGSGAQWDYLVEYIKLHNLLDRSETIPRKALHLFNEPHWRIDIRNKILYRGIEVKPALLNSYINAAVNASNIEDFLQNQATAVFTWLSDAKPQLDKNQLKRGWTWLFEQARTWQLNNATEIQLSLVKWECKFGAVTLGQYRFVPLSNAWQVRQEALSKRHCADHFIDNCRAGNYRLYSVYFNTGKHKATLGLALENGRWEVHQIRSFANQPVSVQLWSIADSIAEGLNIVNEGSDERADQTLITASSEETTGCQNNSPKLDMESDVEGDDDAYDGSFCPICHDLNGACNHLVACSDRFGGGVVGGVVDAKKDEILAMVTALFEYCIKQKIEDCGLGSTFNSILEITKTRESEGELISDILWEYSQPLEYAICELIDEDDDVYHTSWERDGMPGMSTIYDNYWAENPYEVVEKLCEKLVTDQIN